MRSEDPVSHSGTCAVGMLSAGCPVLSPGSRAHIPPMLLLGLTVISAGFL